MLSSRVLTTAGELDDILPAWEQLLAQSPSSSIFLTHPYLSTWWKHFGDGLSLVVGIVEDGTSLLAAAPLCLRRARVCGATVRVLEVLGTGPVPTRPMGLSDRVDWPVRAGHEDKLALLFESLFEMRSRWDVLHLKGVCLDESPLAGVLDRLPGKSPVALHRHPRYRSPYLPLTGTFGEYTATRSRNFRKQLARHRRKLLTLGPLEIEEGDKLGPELLMDEILRISQSSWKGRRGSGLFLNPEVRSFFTELFTILQARGWMWVRFLKSAGRRIAHEICFAYGGKLYSYNSCFEAEFGSHSPGEVLTSAVLEQAFAGGFKEYDMLRGEEPYKTRWSRSVRQEHEVTLSSSGLKAPAYRFFQIRVKAWIRSSRTLSELDDKASSMFHKVFTNKSLR